MTVPHTPPTPRRAPADVRPESWAPAGATVLVARDAQAIREARQLRFRIYVREQGKRPPGVDWARGELADALDPVSSLWLARDGATPVGTLTRTTIRPGFDLALLPPGLALDGFPCSARRPLTFSSRCAIAPDHRGRWVLPALTRRTYVHGRSTGAVFDVMATNPALVPLFERLGYVRYTASAVRLPDVGTLIPMTLVGTDLDHLRRVRSPCLVAATLYPDEPRWGAWLRATHPIVDAYYGDPPDRAVARVALARQYDLPAAVAEQLVASAFVHRFPAGSTIVGAGERLTCGFVALEGRLVGRRAAAASALACAPDGVAFSPVTLRCDTDAAILCLPAPAIERAERLHPALAPQLRVLRDSALAASQLPSDR